MSSEKLLINNPKSNSSEVMSNKQIKEISKDLCQNTMCGLDEWNDCDLPDGCYCNRCIKLAINLYNAGYRKQEWISVDERLPEKDDVYLVCLSGLPADFDRFVVVDGEEGYFEHCKVTHWLPIPEAPKMKGGAE